MKLSLAIKISLKDYLPKWKSIPYDDFVCLIKCDNNLISQIKFSELSEKNCINHKIDSFNSNIIYNFHVLDAYKKTLIGVCHLCINFEKIKNLNINDTLTQEGNYKLFIDANTKRKFFDNITNMGEIYLIISTEIKILKRKSYEPNKFKSFLYSLNSENKNNIKNITNNFLNLQPNNSKKKQIITKMKNDHESLNILDTITGKSELNTNTHTKILEDNDYNTFYQGTVIKKNKSINKTKVNLKNIIKYNNNFDKTNRFNFNNSCTEIMSPKYNNTNYSKRKNRSKKKSRISLNNNKISILNLMEQKIDKSKLKQNDSNIIESNTQIDNACKFNKTQMGKNFGGKDYYTFNKLSCEHKEKRDGKASGEFDNFKKKNKNKIQINLLGKNDISTERKLNSKKNLGLIDYSRINTEIFNNNNFISHKKNASLNSNINNIFLQTETMISTSKKIPNNKISINKKFLRNLNIKLLNYH